jgi:ribosomal protein L37E
MEQDRFPRPATYEILRNEKGQESIRCRLCGRESFHPDDVKERYCAFCHVFHQKP